MASWFHFCRSQEHWGITCNQNTKGNMAFKMSAVAPSTKFLAPRPVALRAQCRRPAGRSALMIQAKTIWQLSPQTGAKNLEFIELNDEINTKKSYVSVGDKQHADAERV